MAARGATQSIQTDLSLLLDELNASRRHPSPPRRRSPAAGGRRRARRSASGRPARRRRCGRDRDRAAVEEVGDHGVAQTAYWPRRHRSASRSRSAGAMIGQVGITSASYGAVIGREPRMKSARAHAARCSRPRPAPCRARSAPHERIVAPSHFDQRPVRRRSPRPAPSRPWR